MVGIRSLQKRALRICVFRGHSMGRWLYGEDRSYALSKCKHCDAFVTVVVSPLPNEIDIGGTAVALNCPYYNKDEREWWDTLRRNIELKRALKRH